MLIENFSPVKVLQNESITVLESVLLNERGELQIVSYNSLKEFTQNQISLFCLKHGYYTIPTTELLAFIKEEIGENTLASTIEICSGNGVMAKELGIRATDNFMQLREDIKKYYEEVGQPTVIYGSHVENIDGNSAVKKYKPKVVLASWCTHKYNPKEHWRGGNALGVNEKLIIERVAKYIHIGNLDTHKHKPALLKPHRMLKPEWLVTRSLNKSQNAIIIWD